MTRMATGKPAFSPRLGEQDIYLFNEGTHSRLYEKLGAHILPDGSVHFAVWAPNAAYVSVIGPFNDWDNRKNPMRPQASSGLWELAIPGLNKGAVYKYHIESRENGYKVDKVDPFGFCHATAPLKESIVCDLDFDWDDKAWMSGRARRQKIDKPVSVYEMHLGSWMRVPEEKHRSLTYRELVPKLAEVSSPLRFHACGIFAADGASVLRVVGISDDGIFLCRRADMVRRRI